TASRPRASSRASLWAGSMPLASSSSRHSHTSHCSSGASSRRNSSGTRRSLATSWMSIHSTYWPRAVRGAEAARGRRAAHVADVLQGEEGEGGGGGVVGDEDLVPEGGQVRHAALAHGVLQR